MVISTYAVRCRYHYDALDRLVASGPVSETGTQRFYQKNRLATEIQGTLKRTIFQHEDVVLAQQHLEGKSGTSLLATDRQRSVLQCLDEAGAESLAYTAYGHHPTDSGLTPLLGFNGERRDPITGHYMLGNGYRAFNPVLMRFNSPDDLGPFGKGGLNTYAYCAGDLVNRVDPTGHFAVWAVLRRALAAIMAWRRRLAPAAVNGRFRFSAAYAAKRRSAPDLRSGLEKYDPPMTLIGFHGSTVENGASLKQGLNPAFMGESAGLSAGRGFYTSITEHIANDFASIAVTTAAEKGFVARPQVYAVHMSHYPLRLSGRDYRMGVMGGGSLALDKVNERRKMMELVVDIRRYGDISIRDKVAGEKVLWPRASEAPSPY